MALKIITMNNIQEAAEKYAEKRGCINNSYDDKVVVYSKEGFIEGALSSAAKEYWQSQQTSISDEDLQALAEKEIPRHPYPEMTYPAEAVTKISRNSYIAGYKANPLHNWLSDVKGLPEVAELDGVINNYVHSRLSKTYNHIQEKFWAAIDAINKSALQTQSSSAGQWRTIDEKQPIEHKWYCGKHLVESKIWWYVNGLWNGYEFNDKDITHYLDESLSINSAVDGWVNIKDSQPEYGKTVIGFFPEKDESGKLVASAYWNGKKLISDFPNSTARYFEATLWQEYPSPPTQ